MQADIKLQKIIPRNGKSTFVVKETLLVWNRNSFGTLESYSMSMRKFN